MCWPLSLFSSFVLAILGMDVLHIQDLRSILYIYMKIYASNNNNKKAILKKNCFE